MVLVTNIRYVALIGIDSLQVSEKKSCKDCGEDLLLVPTHLADEIHKVYNNISEKSLLVAAGWLEIRSFKCTPEDTLKM